MREAKDGDKLEKPMSSSGLWWADDDKTKSLPAVCPYVCLDL
jgi:hypothetical protein